MESPTNNHGPSSSDLPTRCEKDLQPSVGVAHSEAAVVHRNVVLKAVRQDGHAIYPIDWTKDPRPVFRASPPFRVSTVFAVRADVSTTVVWEPEPSAADRRTNMPPPPPLLPPVRKSYCVNDIEVRPACLVVLVSLGTGRRAPASDMVRGRTDAEAAGHSRRKRKRCGYLRLKGGLRQEDDLDRCNCGEGEHGCNDGDVSGTGGLLQRRGGQLQRSRRGDAGLLGAVVPGRWRPREGRRREPDVVELSVLAARDRVRTPVC